jgi:sec-independent protein translocase protein TatA
LIGFFPGLGYNTCAKSVGSHADPEGDLPMEGLLQPVHLLFILLIVLILFGPGKLPELGKGLGKGIREFKDALRGGIEGSSEKK